MDTKNLYKQTFNFEKRILQLDTHDDSLSGLDWHKLAEELDSGEPTVNDVSVKFQMKLAQIQKL